MKSLQKFGGKMGWAICLILSIFTLTSFGQQFVTGKITSSEDSQGIPGVNVSVKGTNKGTASDANGNYKIAADSKAKLTFSAIGFISQEIEVGTKSTIDLKMATDIQSLSEVVVVGYGTQKKSQMTGAISSISAKEIAELPITNARQALQGRAAGVEVSQAGSKPGAGPQIRIRGRRSFNASNDPLFVVDGIPLSGGIDDINPNDISYNRDGKHDNNLIKIDFRHMNYIERKR